jgi:mono/diheme cytochrome c family protein
MRLFVILTAGILSVPPAMADGTDPIDTGKDLYLENCQVCHGADAREGSGGDIRGTSFRKLRKAVGGIEQMPEFDLTDDELNAVWAFLTSL